MAAFFWIHAGANTNWNTVNNWSATSGGGTNAATPSVTSDVTFDGAGANGNDASIVSAAQSVLSLTFTTGYTNSVTINTTVVLTIAGNFTDRTNHSWVVSGTGSMAISAASTITSNGKTFPGPVTLNGATTTTYTLSGGDWTVTGLMTINTGTKVINGNTLIMNGGLAISQVVTGTTTFAFGGGTWSGGGAPQNNITLQGNVTVSGSISYSVGTLTYSSGTITTTGSTLSLGNTSGTTTMNTNGMTWNNVSLSGSNVTIVLNSLLSVSGTFTIQQNVIFSGSAGWTVATLSHTGTSALTTTLVNGVTYTVTTAFNCFTSRTGSIILWTSDHATNKANLILNNGCTCNVLASFTRIDASGGRVIYTFNGTITTCLNIEAITNLTFDNAVTRVIQAGGNY